MRPDAPDGLLKQFTKTVLKTALEGELTEHLWHEKHRAHVGRRRPKVRVFVHDDVLRELVAAKLAKKWSPAQISRWLRRRHPSRPQWHVCHETIYEGIYRSVIVVSSAQNLHTGRTYRQRRGRDRSKDGSLKLSTRMRSIHDRPKNVESRHQAAFPMAGCFAVDGFDRSLIETRSGIRDHSALNATRRLE